MCMRKTSVCPRNLHNKDKEDPSEKKKKKKKTLFFPPCAADTTSASLSVKLARIITATTLHNQTAPEYECDLNLY